MSLHNLSILSRVNKADPKFFSPTSSPPIVIAFLCVGTFGVGILAILGWTRQFNRWWYAPDIPTVFAPDPPEPELWDAWVRPYDSGFVEVHDFKKPLCGASFDGQTSDLDKPHCQEDATQLQLAVIIAMPRSSPRNVPLEYSISICRTPWHRDEG